MLADMAVATELHSVELSSGKCDVLISYFQTAVFSIGFDVDAIKHERSLRFKRFNIKRQRIQKQHVAPVLYSNKLSKTSKCGRRPSNNIAFAISHQKAKRLETAKFESSLKMVCILEEMLRESGVKLAEEMGCRMRGMVKRKLLCSVIAIQGLL